MKNHIFYNYNQSTSQLSCRFWDTQLPSCQGWCSCLPIFLPLRGQCEDWWQTTSKSTSVHFKFICCHTVCQDGCKHHLDDHSVYAIIRVGIFTKSHFDSYQQFWYLLLVTSSVVNKHLGNSECQSYLAKWAWYQKQTPVTTCHDLDLPMLFNRIRRHSFTFS